MTEHYDELLKSLRHKLLFGLGAGFLGGLFLLAISLFVFQKWISARKDTSYIQLKTQNDELHRQKSMMEDSERMSKEELEQLKVRYKNLTDKAGQNSEEFSELHRKIEEFEKSYQTIQQPADAIDRLARQCDVTIPSMSVAVNCARSITCYDNALFQHIRNPTVITSGGVKTYPDAPVLPPRKTSTMSRVGMVDSPQAACWLDDDSFAFVNHEFHLVRINRLTEQIDTRVILPSVLRDKNNQLVVSHSFLVFFSARLSELWVFNRKSFELLGKYSFDGIHTIHPFQNSDVICVKYDPHKKTLPIESSIQDLKDLKLLNLNLNTGAMHPFSIGTSLIPDCRFIESGSIYPRSRGSGADLFQVIGKKMRYDKMQSTTNRNEFRLFQGAFRTDYDSFLPSPAGNLLACVVSSTPRKIEILNSDWSTSDRVFLDPEIDPDCLAFNSDGRILYGRTKNFILVAVIFPKDFMPIAPDSPFATKPSIKSLRWTNQVQGDVMKTGPTRLIPYPGAKKILLAANSGSLYLIELTN
jgi:hypothetical protein